MDSRGQNQILSTALETNYFSLVDSADLEVPNVWHDNVIGVIFLETIDSL